MISPSVCLFVSQLSLLFFAKSNFSFLLWKLLRTFFFSPNRSCFPQDLHEAFFVLLFLRPRAAAKCNGGECHCSCAMQRWRVLPLIARPLQLLSLRLTLATPRTNATPRKCSTGRVPCKTGKSSELFPVLHLAFREMSS